MEIVEKGDVWGGGLHERHVHAATDTHVYFKEQPQHFPHIIHCQRLGDFLGWADFYEVQPVRPAAGSKGTHAMTDETTATFNATTGQWVREDAEPSRHVEPIPTYCPEVATCDAATGKWTRPVPDGQRPVESNFNGAFCVAENTNSDDQTFRIGNVVRISGVIDPDHMARDLARRDAHRMLSPSPYDAKAPTPLADAETIARLKLSVADLQMIRSKLDVENSELVAGLKGMLLAVHGMIGVDATNAGRIAVARALIAKAERGS